MILSVPHSGTRFLMERLGDTEFAHTTWGWDMIWAKLEKSQHEEPIVPMRDPFEVWRSWCRRNKADAFPYADFFLAWGKLHALDQMMELDVICVDKKEDPRIDDWSNIGNGDANHSDWKLIRCDLRHLYELPIVKRHYGAFNIDVPYSPYNLNDQEPKEKRRKRMMERNRLISNG